MGKLWDRQRAGLLAEIGKAENDPSWDNPKCAVSEYVESCVWQSSVMGECPVSICTGSTACDGTNYLNDQELFLLELYSILHFMDGQEGW